MMEGFSHLVGHELRQSYMLALRKLTVKVSEVAFGSELQNDATFIQILKIQEVQELHEMGVILNLGQSCSLYTKDDLVGCSAVITSSRNDLHGEYFLVLESLDFEHSTETATTDALLDFVLELTIAERHDGGTDRKLALEAHHVGADVG